MPRTSYQYGTSPRKYEPEYTQRRTTKTTAKKPEAKRASKKSDAQRRIEQQRAKKAQEKKYKILQIAVVLAVFGMLLTVSYREISIMEMFNQKKDLENQLALIEKENGQVEKSIKEEESKLDWSKIRQRATDELGMQQKDVIPVDLEKSDNVETSNKLLVEEEKTSLLEKIVSFFVNKDI